MPMSFLQTELQMVCREFPNTPIEAIRSAAFVGVSAFAWWKDGVLYVGTTGKTLKEVAQEIDTFTP